LESEFVELVAGFSGLLVADCAGATA